ncbi:hypothetical protein CBR_g8432 [Chara braunii]|uniref:CCHC-type domain-containing protein n=1 Tax=Chara braunii TaxID=69332 RepID=A0A388KM54_CHABU|nr:hypothetical protein CBR_g8432 [Chara braunii]|eukprot:GBG71131.1 hypothetical protein CBR_g8432 [Chara braunii]
MKYVLHGHHQEVQKVVDDANGDWARFREGMQRKYRLGDGLLTTTDLEAMNKDDFTTIGAFVQEFKKRARKVHGMLEEAQCAIFLGLLNASEASELTSHGGGSAKLTWATIDKGVEDGSLDQVEQHQVRLQRKKRKEGDATTCGTPGVKKIVTDVLAKLDAVIQRKVVTTVQGKTKEAVVEEATRRMGGRGVGTPTPLKGATLNPRHHHRHLHKVSQGSVAGGGNQGQGNQGNGGRGGGRGRGRNGGGRGGQWDNQGYQGQGSQGSQGNQGSQGGGRTRFDWRTAICQHCDKQGHTIRFCNTRRENERVELIYSNIDGDIYDQFGEYIDRKVPGGVRAEAQRRVAARQAPPARFRLWQEREDPPIGVEEVGSDEEVTQRLRAGVIREESIVIESEDESEEKKVEPAAVLLGKMEDLLDKVGRYQRKLVGFCEEVKEWRVNLPKVFLYDSGPESMPGRPGVAIVGSGPRSGMMTRPPTPQGRLGQAARTRGQAKASASQESPRKKPDPGKRKETVEVEDDDEDEEEDDRLRQEEDQRAEQRARKRESREEAKAVLRDVPPKKKKYAVRLEEGFDVERVIDGLLEGHNDLMTLKEILASAPRLRNELKGSMSRRLVSNVHLSVILPKEMEWSEPGTKMDWKCVACGMVDLVVRGSKCAAMVDTGAEMNIIRVADAIRSDFAKTAMPRGGRGTRPPRRPLGASGGYKRHGSYHRESTPVYDDGDIELFLDEFWGYADHMGWTMTQAIGRLRGVGRFAEPIAQIRREARTRSEGLTAPDKSEVETSQKEDEYLDRRIRSLSKTSFDRYMMLEADLRGKEMRETSHGVHLEVVEVEVRELKALVASLAAIIRDLRQPLRGGMDGAESSRQGEQRQPGGGVPEQPPAAEPQQGAPMGRVILEPEEAKAKREAEREAEREAFEFRTPTELAILPTVTAGPTMPPSVEKGLPAANGEPIKGSKEGSMDVLLEAVHTMQEGASLCSHPRIEEPPESEMGVAMEDVIEGMPQRLDTPEYRPEEIGLRLGTRTQELEAGSEEPMDLPQSYELSREASEAPSSSWSQRRKERPKKSFDSTCFFCKKREHRALQCPKFLKDLAEGKVSESGGRMYDRQGRIVERSSDGGRAQLYRQNQEEMSE